MRSEGEKWSEPSVSFRIDQATYGQGETAARLLLGTRRGDQHLHMGMIQQRAKQRDRGAWKESLQVREIRDCPEFLPRTYIEEYLLLLTEQIQNVIERTLTLAIPDHEPIRRILSHRYVFGHKVPEVSSSRRRRDRNVMPGAQIVATVAVHAIDANVRVPLLGKVGLDSSIGAIRIAYKYCEIVGENFIESLANELVQTGQLS